MEFSIEKACSFLLLVAGIVFVQPAGASNNTMPPYDSVVMSPVLAKFDTLLPKKRIVSPNTPLSPFSGSKPPSIGSKLVFNIDSSTYLQQIEELKKQLNKQDNNFKLQKTEQLEKFNKEKKELEEKLTEAEQCRMLSVENLQNQVKSLEYQQHQLLLEQKNKFELELKNTLDEQKNKFELEAQKKLDDQKVKCELETKNKLDELNQNLVRNKSQYECNLANVKLSLKEAIVAAETHKKAVDRMKFWGKVAAWTGATVAITATIAAVIVWRRSGVTIDRLKSAYSVLMGRNQFVLSSLSVLPVSLPVISKPIQTLIFKKNI